MKTFTVVCFLAVLGLALAGRRSRATYTDRFDNLNLDEILGNHRILVSYMKCVLEQGKCSPEGKELKAHISEALETDCGKCTEKQKVGARRVLTHLVQHEPDYWNQLVAKYDPTHKYTRKYEKDINAARGV